MPTNVNVCAYLSDEKLSARLVQICALQGWTVWHWDSRTDADIALTHLPAYPDIIFFDDPLRHAAIANALGPHQGTVLACVYSPPANPDLPGSVALLNQETSDSAIIEGVTMALNVTRFQTQFAAQTSTEPITKLPHHPELLQDILRYRGQGMGVIVVQIDHAEHLYANLDPVSKTDLLGAMSDHLSQVLPHVAHMGLFDAATFAIWLPCAESAEVARLGEQLLERCRAPIDFRSGSLHITTSLGLTFASALVDPAALWQQAWSAKDSARAAGGNQIVSALRDAELKERIPDALMRNEFSLVLQPQWNIRGDELRGVESLLRWQGMEVGDLAPEHFIPIAERNAQMARVGDWVLEHASCESVTWLEHLLSPITLGVNVSPQQFVHGAIRKQVARLAADQWLDPSILELELSHTNLLHVVDQHRSALYELCDLGVSIAIDNLGVGIVDTNKLLRCPADTLKIDRSVIARVETDGQAKALVEQICLLGQRFSLRVVAVGVEQESQRALLEDLGCTDAQGYLFAEPVPLDKFQQYLSALTQPEERSKSG
jgi:EAL domain-containing protein (putative c-di-GMP-specific phosphodiesterase class I)/GGDEF domain-containing protein